MTSLSMLQLLAGAIGAGAIVLSSHRLRLLDTSGALAAFGLGTMVFGLGGWSWAVPLLAFFAASSLLSRLGRVRKQPAEHRYAKSSRRDAWQVLANGGAGAAVLLAAFVPSELPYVFFLGAMAAVNADTWSTEIGPMTQSRPRLITRFTQVPAGTSGAVSWGGTLAAWAGGAWIALSAVWVYPFQGAGAGELLAVLSLTGLFGSLFDSLLGAGLQVQYRCPVCGSATEKRRHCRDQIGVRIRGFAALQNDMVNALTAVAGGSAAVLIFRLWHLTNG